MAKQTNTAPATTPNETLPEAPDIATARGQNFWRYSGGVGDDAAKWLTGRQVIERASKRPVAQALLALGTMTLETAVQHWDAKAQFIEVAAASLLQSAEFAALDAVYAPQYKSFCQHEASQAEQARIEAETLAHAERKLSEAQAEAQRKLDSDAAVAAARETVAGIHASRANKNH